MGRVERGRGREAAAFSMGHLLGVHSRTPEPRVDLPERQELIRKPPFPVEVLPPQWAVAFDQDSGICYPVCTWGACAEKYYYLTEEGAKVPGNFLMTSAAQTIEDAAGILLYHLEHAHRLKNVVAPYEPYGKIWAKPRTKAWK